MGKNPKIMTEYNTIEYNTINQVLEKSTIFLFYDPFPNQRPQKTLTNNFQNKGLQIQLCLMTKILYQEK